METNCKPFEVELQKLKMFFSERRKLGYLATRVGVNVRTVHLAFKAKSSDELTGKKIDIVLTARKLKIEMEAELNTLFADEVPSN